MDSFSVPLESHVFHAPSLGNLTHTVTLSRIRGDRMGQNMAATQGQKICMLKLTKSLPCHEAIIHEWGHQPCPAYFPKLPVMRDT